MKSKQFNTMKALAAIALVLLLALSAAAESLREKHGHVVRFLEREDFHQAEKTLREIEKSSPGDFARNNYDYLLARIREHGGDLDGATAYFLRAMNRNSILSEYALWHLAGIERAKGSLASEQSYLKQLIEKYPTSLLKEQAEKRLAENYFESGDLDQAIQAYGKFATGRGQLAREAQLRIALAERQRGRLDEARSGFERLIQSGRDDVALQAGRALDALDRELSVQPSLDDHVNRAGVYQANRAFDEARSHYQQVVDRDPNHRYASEALFEIGRGYYQQREFDKAIEWFERAHERFPGTSEGEQGYYQVGHAHARAGRSSEAVERYEKFIAEYPKSESLPGAHLNAIDALRSAGQDDAALEWCQRTISRFPGELAAVTALFSQARIHLAQGNFQSALEDFNQLLKQNLERSGPSAPNCPEVTYTRGRVLEQLGQLDEAVNVYLNVPDERGSYYGWRATLRLGELASRRDAKPIIERRFKSLRTQARSALKARRYEQAKAAAMQALRLALNDGDRRRMRQLLAEIYRRLPNYHRVAGLQVVRVGRAVLAPKDRQPTERSARALASELIFLGLHDEGALELAASMGRPAAARSNLSSPIGESDLSRAVNDRVSGMKTEAQAPTLNQLYTLAVYLNRGEHAYEAARIGEIHLAPRVPTDYPLELLPRELARALYPTPYRRLLEEHIARRNIDAAFALAVMREESRFRPDAKSLAAARGLMQFVPETARRLAEKTGLSRFEEDDLYKPEVSIRLASVYLEGLFQMIPGNYPAVAAAYNAGEDNAQRWLARARSGDPDRFVIEIGFRETKEYVYRVMANYWAYKRILVAGFVEER